MIRWIAFWYSILSMLTETFDHSRLFALTYACSRMRSCSISSRGVSYATMSFVDSHLNAHAPSQLTLSESMVRKLTLNYSDADCARAWS